MTMLLSHTILSAHDNKTGRYDAKRIAATLAITQAEMAEIVGYSTRGLNKNPSSPRLQEKLAALVSLIGELRELLDGNMDYVLIWLKAPHPYLDKKTPLSVLKAGNLEAVQTLVHMMWTGQPA